MLNITLIFWWCYSLEFLLSFLFRYDFPSVSFFSRSMNLSTLTCWRNSDMYFDQMFVISLLMLNFTTFLSWTNWSTGRGGGISVMYICIPRTCFSLYLAIKNFLTHWPSLLSLLSRDWRFTLYSVELLTANILS